MRLLRNMASKLAPPLFAFAGLLIVGGIGIAATSTSNSGTASSHPSYSDTYGVLSEHNIFVRDRYRATSRHYEPTTHTSPPIEESLVLTGIVIESQGLRAYVENTSTHDVQRLSPGDAVAHGKVGAIEIDAFDYIHDGQQTWIEAGCDLTGRPATLEADTPTTNESSSASTPSTQPSGAPTNSNSSNLSLEEQMKLRRQQQLNQR